MKIFAKKIICLINSLALSETSRIMNFSILIPDSVSRCFQQLTKRSTGDIDKNTLFHTNFTNDLYLRRMISVLLLLKTQTNQLLFHHSYFLMYEIFLPLFQFLGVLKCKKDKIFAVQNIKSDSDKLIIKTKIFHALLK